VSVADETLRYALAKLASQVKRERVDWLEGMEGRVPRRSVTMLVGDPGLGKSMLSLLMAARVGQAGGFALVATVEDSPAAVVRPRLDALQADLERVAFVELWQDGSPDGRLLIPDDAVELEKLVAECAADLMIVDPLVAHLPGEINSWRDQSVRLALAPLHALAERQNCAVLALAHLNKSTSTDWLRRIGGSVGITGAARSVLLMARDPDDPEGEKGSRRVLAHVKSNMGPLAAGLLCKIEPVLVPARGEEPEVETARVVELGPCDHDAERLLVGRRHPEERDAVEEAVAFLQEELADGPKDAKAVKRAAQEADIHFRTLDRAKAKAGVHADKVGFGEGGKWMWQLRTPTGLAHLANGNVGALSANQYEQRDSADEKLLRTPIVDSGALRGETTPEDEAGPAHIDVRGPRPAGRFCEGCDDNDRCAREPSCRLIEVAAAASRTDR
jgi:AAA domain